MTTYACHACDVPPMTGDEAMLHTHKPGHLVYEVPAPELWSRDDV